MYVYDTPYAYDISISREQNKQKTVMNINPFPGFMNTSTSNFVYCRIVDCQQHGNNGPILRSQNPFVNISHSICVQKWNGVSYEFRSIFYNFHYFGMKFRNLIARLRRIAHSQRIELNISLYTETTLK